MEAVKQNTHPTLASESFRHGRKHYFIDIKKAVNDTHFLLITSSETFQNYPKYYRRTIQLWEEDLAQFVEALTMVLNRLAYGDLEPILAEMKVVKDPTGVKALAAYDRPREKLLALGAGTLGNSELLSVRLCTGSPELPVLDLCGKMMQSVDDDPSRLLSRSAEDFCRFPGIGVAKAATLLAAFELGRRAFLSHKH